MGNTKGKLSLFVVYPDLSHHVQSGGAVVE